MSTTDIKSVVKQKYGEAALRVKTGRSSCCGASATTGCADPITSNLYDSMQAGQIPEEALLASLGAEIQPPWRNSTPERLCSTLAQAVVSTCCCLPSEWAQPEKPMVW